MKIGPVLMLVGGGAAAASPFLPWINVGSASMNAIGTTDGKVMLACGIICAALGLLALTGKGVPKASLMIVGILAGLAAAGIGAYDYKKARDLIKLAGDGVSIGIGLYAGMVGGALAAIGSLIRPKAQG